MRTVIPVTLQDISLAIQNQHILPAQASNGVYTRAQESEAIVTEAMSGPDHVERRFDSIPANDPVFNHNTFPPITTLHGI